MKLAGRAHLLIQNYLMTGAGRFIHRIQDAHDFHAVLRGVAAGRAGQNAINEMIDFIFKQAVKGQGGRHGQIYIGQIAVQIGEQFQLGIELGARLGTEQFNFAAVFLNIQREAALQLGHSAVIITDDGCHSVFDVKDVVIGGRGRTVYLLVLELGAE